jgi:hypothetical protein
MPFLNPLANLLEGRRWDEPMMQMNRANLNRMFHLLHAAGCQQVLTQLTDHGGELGALLVFRKT